MVRRSVFIQIFREMRSINARLTEIERKLSNKSTKMEIPESSLFSLPDHLRRSYLIVISRGEASSTETSIGSGRCRALESNYLNQLTRMGWLIKSKRSKTTYFSPVNPMPIKASN